MDLRWRPNTVRVRLDNGWLEVYKKRDRCRPLPDADAFLRTTLAAMTAASDVVDDGVRLDLTTPEGWAELPGEVREHVYAKAVRPIVAGWKDLEEVRNLCE